MTSSMNHNNNQKSAESQENEEQTNSMPQNEVLQETREVVKRFLERSLSQNAQNSMAFMKPEGYHKLKKEGKLPYYQRQQSKPEQGNLLKRPGIGRRKSAGATTAMQVSGAWPSDSSRAYAGKRKSFDRSKDQQSKYLSEIDIRTVQGLSESEMTTKEQHNSFMFQLLNAQGAQQDNSSQSYDSLPSTGDGGASIRRESFTKAVSRKSVISDIERSNARAKRTNGGTSTHIRQSSTPAAVTNHIKDANRIDRQCSCFAEVAGRESTLSCDIPLNKEDEKPKKTTGFREKMKKMISKPKKQKKLKPTEGNKTEDMTSEDGGRRRDVFRAHSAGARLPNSTEEELKRKQPVPSTTGATLSSARRQSHKPVPLMHHKSPSPDDRSPSPNKSKTPLGTPKLLQRAFSLKKLSPKPKRYPVHHSDSSSSLFLLSTVQENNNGQLEKNKSGSLPTSMRYGINLQPSTGTRRFSVDLLSPKEIKKSLKRSPSPSHKHHHEHHERHHHNHHHQNHHHHHNHHHENDVEEKKSKSVGILRRIFRIRKFRKRHTSESSTASSRSHSLPSIPAALDQENEREESSDRFDDVSKYHSHAENGDSVGKLPSSDEHKPYHHRGSLSFSSGDISLLSAPEHQKVIDEIADALRRVSQKYTKRLQSRSNPSSRYVTPESSLTSADYQHYNKLPRSGPPSRQTSVSRGPVHSTGKSFRKYDKTEKPPSLAAFYNLSKQRRENDPRLDKSAAVMPRPIHHSKSGSLDSPRKDYSDCKLPVPKITLQQPSPPRPSSPLTEDVVDGVPLSKSVNGFSSDEGNMKETYLSTEAEFFSMISTQIDGSVQTETQVDFASAETIVINQERTIYGEPLPSTNKVNDDEDEDDDILSHMNNPYTEEIEDEDKLVQLLVEALIKKGDDINRRMEPNCSNPVFQRSVFSLITKMSFTHFRQFAHRFCSTCKRLVENPPSRHPEIFSVVMVFNMLQYVSSNAPTHQTLNQIYDYASRYINNWIVDSGNTWESVLAQLRDTEEELTQEEWDDLD